MSEDKPNRFYKEVSVAEVNEKFLVQLDGRTAKTPGRQELGSTTRALTDAIATEWSEQVDVIDLGMMPLTRLQGFALDGGAVGRGEWSDLVLSYLGSDLLCYRAPDPALAERQAASWQPILDRQGEAFAACFAVTEGIISVDQPPELIQAAAQYLVKLTSGELFAVKLLTEITGSAALAVALEKGEIETEAAFAASRLDEIFQEEKWGVDDEAAERTRRRRQDFETVIRFMELSRG